MLYHCTRFLGYRVSLLSRTAQRGATSLVRPFCLQMRNVEAIKFLLLEREIPSKTLSLFFFFITPRAPELSRSLPVLLQLVAELVGLWYIEYNFLWRAKTTKRTRWRGRLKEGSWESRCSPLLTVERDFPLHIITHQSEVDD